MVCYSFPTSAVFDFSMESIYATQYRHAMQLHTCYAWQLPIKGPFSSSVFFDQPYLKQIIKSCWSRLCQIPTRQISLVLFAKRLLLDTSIPYDEKTLLLRIADGDENAFRSLFNQYTSLLLPYVTRFVNSQAIGEEIVQEVFVRVWMHRDQLPQIENPHAWIFRIAANECHRFIRRRELERNTQNLLAQKESAAIHYEADLKELQHAIEEAIALMPEKRRRIYQLSRVEGMKPSEIAEQLGLSVSTVKNTLVTALEGIRAHLIKKGLFVWACFIFLK